MPDVKWAKVNENINTRRPQTPSEFFCWHQIKPRCCWKSTFFSFPLRYLSDRFSGDGTSFMTTCCARIQTVFNFRRLCCSGRCTPSEILGLRADRWRCHSDGLLAESLELTTQTRWSIMPVAFSPILPVSVNPELGLGSDLASICVHTRFRSDHLWSDLYIGSISLSGLVKAPGFIPCLQDYNTTKTLE